MANFLCFTLLSTLIIRPSQSCWSESQTKLIHSAPGPEPCGDILSQKVGIYMIAYTPKRFLLITDGLNVMEQKDEQPNGFLKQITLNPMAISMKNNHGILHRSPHWEALPYVESNAFTIFDGEAEYLAINVRHKYQPEMRTILYDLDNKQMYPGLRFWDLDHEIFISTPKRPVLYYALRHGESGPEMVAYKLSTSTIREYLEKSTNRYLEYEDKQELLDIYSHWNLICVHEGKHDVVVVMDPVYRKSCRPVKWRIHQGFVHNDHFYLFDTKQVYVIEEIAFHIQGEPFTIEIIPLRKFFKCPNGHGSSSSFSGGNGSDGRQVLASDRQRKSSSKLFVESFCVVKIEVLLLQTVLDWSLELLGLTIFGLIGFFAYSQRQKRLQALRVTKRRSKMKTNASKSSLISSQTRLSFVTVPPHSPITNQTIKSMS